MLFKGSCTLLAAGALLFGEALASAGSPFERFADISRNKGYKMDKRTKEPVKRAAEKQPFRYLNKHTKGEKLVRMTAWRNRY